MLLCIYSIFYLYVFLHWRVYDYVIK